MDQVLRHRARAFALFLLASLSNGAGLPALAFITNPNSQQQSARVALGSEISSADVKSLILEAGRLQLSGDYEAAVKIWERLLAWSEIKQGPGHLDTASSLSGLANLYLIVGEYALAENLFRRSLSIREQVLGTDDVLVAVTLSDLGNTLKEQGKYAIAAQLLNRSLDIYKKKDDLNAIGVAAVMSNIGSIFTFQRDFSKAEASFLASIEIREKAALPEDLNLATTLNELGNMYMMKGSYEKASVSLQKSLRIKEFFLGPEHSEIGLINFNLGKFYSKEGRYLEAAKYFLKAVKISEDSLGPWHSQTGAYVQALGQLYRKMKLLSKAEPYYKRGLEISEKSLGMDHPHTASAQESISDLYFSQSKFEIGLRFLRQGLSAHLKWLLTEVPLLPASNRQSQLLAIGHADEVLYSLIGLYRPATSFAIETRLNLQGILQEIEQRQGLLSGSTAQEQKLISEIQFLTQQISGIAISSAKRRELEGLRESRERELLLKIPGLVLSPTSFTQVAAALPKDALLIEFKKFISYDFGQVNKWGIPRYLALVLFPDGGVSSVQLGPAIVIDDAIYQALKATAVNNSDASQHWARVSRLVLSPIKVQLTGRRQWFISPDGELNRVPFAALPSPLQPSNTIGSAVQLRLLTTGRDLLRLEKSTAKGQSSLVIANPNYDRPPLAASYSIPSNDTQFQQRSSSVGSDRWSPLPATKMEGEHVAALLGVNSITGDQATTTRLQLSKGPRVLHVATHGFFAPDQETKPNDSLRSLQETGRQVQGFKGESPMLRSGLVLAGANQPNANPNDDGYLTAAEAVNLNLNGTELVVLSACSTGQGDIRSGEGVYGLQRALTVAGARSTLLSLWKVDDKATAGFMVRFYKRLKAGEPRSDALAATQKEFRDGKTGIPGWSDPFYWAAWQLVGDWRPIKGL